MIFLYLALYLPAFVMLHVTEEFLFPGGFIEWYKEFRPALAKGIKPGYIVWINTLMMGACVIPVYLGPSLQGLTVWYIISAIGAANACFHVLGVKALKKYSPGVVTGVLLYIPLFLYGTSVLMSYKPFSLLRMLVCIAIAVGYHLLADKGHKAAAEQAK